VRERIARSASIISLGNLASRLLGLVRDQLIAAIFGRGAATDVFVVASQVSTALYDLLVGNALSSALVPVFSERVGDPDRRRLWRLVSGVLNLALAVTVVGVALLVVLAPWVVEIVGGGFSAEVKALALAPTRIALLAVVAMAAAAVFTAALYAFQEFTFPSFSAAVFNLGIIVSAILFHNRLEVNSLALGMALGALAQVALQAPPLLGRRYRYSLYLDLLDPEIRRILRLYAPVMAGLLVSTIGIIIDRNLASRTGEGSIAAMNFATRLIQLPLGLVSTAIASATLPILSQAAGDLEGFKRALAGGLKLIVFLILPATVGLAVLAIPVIAVLFQHGAFRAQDTAVTAGALLLYLPGLPFAAVDQLFIFAYYARKNTLTPVLVGVCAIGMYLATALALIGPYGMRGLVVANSVQWTFHALVLGFLLWRSVQGLGGQGLFSTTAKAILAGAVMAMASYLGVHLLTGVFGSSGLVQQLGLVLAAGSLGLGVYVLTMRALGVEEALLIWSLFRRKAQG
jgi:putative peptidoglycan lipid II flippase